MQSTTALKTAVVAPGLHDGVHGGGGGGPGRRDHRTPSKGNFHTTLVILFILVSSGIFSDAFILILPLINL